MTGPSVCPNGFMAVLKKLKEHYDLTLLNLNPDEYFNKIRDFVLNEMLNIIKAHKSLGIHKYSMHPSSYFVVDGKLKSINYFFTYHKDEPNISIADVESHIYSTRQDEMRKHLDTLNIEWDKPQSWDTMDKLCWQSFRTNYPDDFINTILEI